MSSPLTYTDVQKTVSITCAAQPKLTDGPVTALNLAMDAANTLTPIASISLSGATFTITLKDARVYSVSIQAGSPVKYKFTGPDFFTLQEFDTLRAIGNAVSALTASNALTDFTATYN